MSVRSMEKSIYWHHVVRHFIQCIDESCCPDAGLKGPVHMHILRKEHCIFFFFSLLMRTFGCYGALHLVTSGSADFQLAYKATMLAVRAA